jgi:hypothetical protein
MKKRNERDKESREGEQRSEKQLNNAEEIEREKEKIKKYEKGIKS